MFRSKLFHRLPAAGQLSAPYYGANESAFVVVAAAARVVRYFCTVLPSYSSIQSIKIKGNPRVITMCTVYLLSVRGATSTSISLST